MGYYDAISSTENLAKAVKRLPNYLRQKFYESTRDYNSENVVTLIEFEIWLQIRISHLFNPIANIIASQETKLKDGPSHARSNYGKILQSEDNKLTCWLCNDKHKLHQYEIFKSKSLPVTSPSDFAPASNKEYLQISCLLRARSSLTFRQL